MADPEQGQEAERERKARKLRELFKGRFSQAESLILLSQHGDNLHQAADFIMKERPEVVQFYLSQQSVESVARLQRESEIVAENLNNHIEHSTRQFACGPCNRSWWTKVPTRKEVSRCRSCRVKYDPVPREKEWGWGVFHCKCGKEFNGYSIYGKTYSKCYQCKQVVLVSEILPPKTNFKSNTKQAWGPRRTKNPHNCSGMNCYNKCEDPSVPEYNLEAYRMAEDPTQPPNMAHPAYNNMAAPGAYPPYMNPQRQYYNGQQQDGQPAQHQGEEYENDQEEEADEDDGGLRPKPATCIHPRKRELQRKRVHYESQPHISTGSTVSTCITQGDLDRRTVSMAGSLETIDEN